MYLIFTNGILKIYNISTFSSTVCFKKLILYKTLIYAESFSFISLRDQNSQHFNEDLLAVNDSAFSFVSCFKAIDYACASHHIISAN